MVFSFLYLSLISFPFKKSSCFIGSAKWIRLFWQIWMLQLDISTIIQIFSFKISFSVDNRYKFNLNCSLFIILLLYEKKGG